MLDGEGCTQVGVLVAERDKKYTSGAVTVVWGEVLPVVDLGETAYRRAQLVSERQVMLQAAMPGQRAES